MYCNINIKTKKRCWLKKLASLEIINIQMICIALASSSSSGGGWKNEKREIEENNKINWFEICCLHTHTQKHTKKIIYMQKKYGINFNFILTQFSSFFCNIALAKVLFVLFDLDFFYCWISFIAFSLSLYIYTRIYFCVCVGILDNMKMKQQNCLHESYNKIIFQLQIMVISSSSFILLLLLLLLL